MAYLTIYSLKHGSQLNCFHILEIWLLIWVCSCCLGTNAVSGSAMHHLEGEISRFHRMPSIDSFNQVSIISDFYSRY